jgi:putative PIN family toxin of toxin-antitoxin system
MIRAVLDANVFVSAMINPQGIPAQLMAGWRVERFQLVVSPAILEEIGQVLRYPKVVRYHRWPEERIQRLLDDLAYLAVCTPGQLTLAVIQDDPPDNRYLECAVEGAAAYIVSGDRLLLTLREYQEIRILTPRSFLEAVWSKNSKSGPFAEEL